MPAIPYLIMGGAQVAGSAIASHGQTVAADKQAEAIEKGIDLQREMYQQDRADFAPYRGLGAGAVGNLAYLSGINMPAAESQSTDAQPKPAPMTLSSLGLPNNPSTPWMSALDQSLGKVSQAEAAYQGPKVKVRSPQGEVREIPAILLPRALQQGGVQVQ